MLRKQNYGDCGVDGGGGDGGGDDCDGEKREHMLAAAIVRDNRSRRRTTQMETAATQHTCFCLGFWSLPQICDERIK